MSAQCWTWTIWAVNENPNSKDYGKEWSPIKSKPKDCQFVGWQQEEGKYSKKSKSEFSKNLREMFNMTKALSDSIETFEIKCSEIGGKLHYQGYLQFYDGCSKGVLAVKHALKCNWANCRISRGTSLQNAEYITKLQTSIAGTYTEFGTMVEHQGFRSDWLDIHSMVEADNTICEILKKYPKKIVYIKAIKEYISDFIKEKYKYKKFEQKDVSVLIGEAGVGKTSAVMNEYNTKEKGGAYLYDGDNGDGKLWFDGYSDQETLVLDDFYGGIKHSKMLHLLDGYHYRLPVKGGFVESRIKRIFITSNDKPNSWYKIGLKKQMLRRINKGFFNLSKNNQGVTIYEEFTPDTEPISNIKYDELGKETIELVSYNSY